MIQRNKITKYELRNLRSFLGNGCGTVDSLRVVVEVDQPIRAHVECDEIDIMRIDVRIRENEDALSSKGLQSFGLQHTGRPPKVMASFTLQLAGRSEKRVVESTIKTLAHLFKIPADSLDPRSFSGKLKITHELEVKDHITDPWVPEGQPIMGSIREHFYTSRDEAVALLGSCDAEKGVHHSDDYWLRWLQGDREVAIGSFSGGTAGASPSHQDTVTVHGTLDYGETNFFDCGVFRNLYRSIKIVPYESQ